MAVWQKNGKSGQCKTCKKEIQTAGGSTSGLHTHLKTAHKINLIKRKNEEEVAQGSKSISPPREASSSIKPFFVSTDETLPAVLARMTAKDGLPFRVICVSDDIRKGLLARGFRNVPTSSNTIQKMVGAYAEKLRCDSAKMLNALKKVCSLSTVYE